MQTIDVTALTEMNFETANIGTPKEMKNIGLAVHPVYITDDEYQMLTTIGVQKQFISSLLGIVFTKEELANGSVHGAGVRNTTHLSPRRLKAVYKTLSEHVEKPYDSVTLCLSHI